MPKQTKRTPNQIEFERQIARLNKIIKQIEQEHDIEIPKAESIITPKRITQQQIQELKKITPKALKEQALNIVKQQSPKVTAKANKKSGGHTQADHIKKGRNRSLEALLRNARRKKIVSQPTHSGQKPSGQQSDDFLGDRKKAPADIFDRFSEDGNGTPFKKQTGEEIIDLPQESEMVIDTVYQLLYDWVFNIEGAHEGYEDIKKADRDLVWAIIGRARAQLGDEQVALNIKNSGSDLEALVNRIIYGSDETTVRFDIAELSRIVNGRSLTIDESIYLTELFENRAYIEYDDEDFESNNPYFATLKGYDSEQ